LSPFECDGALLERKLWLAVLLQAIEDWRSANIRRQREADSFLFQSQKDFGCVCAKAGVSPGSLLPKLERLRPTLRSPLDQHSAFNRSAISTL